MYMYELPPIPMSPRPSIPPPTPRSLPKIPLELPRLVGRDTIVSEISGSVVDEVLERVMSNAACEMRCAPPEQKKGNATALHKRLEEHALNSEKTTNPSKAKKKRRKTKPKQSGLSITLVEALHPQTQNKGAILFRARIDDGLQKVEQQMSEMALQRLAAIRKASEEQRARAHKRALSRLRNPPQDVKNELDTSQMRIRTPESARLPRPKRVMRQRSLHRQTSGTKLVEKEIHAPCRFLSEDTQIADDSVLSVLKSSRNKSERMTDLRKRASEFKKEVVRKTHLAELQTSFNRLPESEKEPLKRIYDRPHNDVQQLCCRLAEFGLIGKDDKEIDEIKAACSKFLASHEDYFLVFALDLVPLVREKLRDGQKEAFLELFASSDRFGLSSGLTEEHCLEIMTDLYVGGVSSSDFDMLKKELSNSFRSVMDPESAKIDAEEFVKLFWHLRVTYDRELAERERRIIEKYGIDIDSDDARNVKDELLSLHELLAKSDNQGERKLDIVDVRGIVGIFIESGLLPYGGDQAAITEQWFNELSGDGEFDFQDLRRLVEKIREDSWQKERRNVERIFEDFDKEGTGSLSRAQVSAFFKSLGLVPRSKSDQDELKRLLDEVDVDASGGLDFGEFSRLVQKVTIKLRSAQRRRENEVAKQLNFTQHQLSELREAYFTLDANKNHLLEINECRKALTLMRIDMSGQDLNELFRVIDRDHDGRIDFEEFLFFVKAVEQPELDWKPFIHDKFITRGDAMMIETARHAIGKLQTGS